MMEKLTPLSHSIIALSPAYHEYNPLLIHTLQFSLTLLNGVDCLLSGKQKHSDKPDTSDCDDSASTFSCTKNIPPKKQQEVQILPLSKCEIVGVVQYCHYKSNGSLNLILDDGTGLCDCIGWIDEDNMMQEDEFGSSCLPRVGDLVRVRGSIRVLSKLDSDPERKRIVPVSLGTYTTTKGTTTCTVDQEVSSQCHGTNTSTIKYYEGWKCIREVRIHNIHVFDERDKWDEEAAHWLRCMQFRQRMDLAMHTNSSVKGTTSNGDYENSNDGDPCRNTTTNTPVLNGLQVLNALPDYYKKNFLNLGASRVDDDDASGANTTVREMQSDERLLVRYFGRQCTCDDNAKVDIKSFKNRLLYCHCIATREKLDPDLIFRDALLTKLLALEDDDQNATQEKDSHLHSSSSKKKDARLDAPWRSLLFGFQSLYDDFSLHSIASETVSKTSDPTLNIRRLYTQTFRHLRKDGVLYLLDEATDTYLLLSKDRVLLPTIDDVIAAEEQMERDLNQSRQNQELGLLHSTTRVIEPPSVPTFLESIPMSKMRLIRRLVAIQRTKSKKL